VVESGKPLGYLTSAYCGINWGYAFHGLTSPTSDKFVKFAYEGAQRLLIGVRGGPNRNRKDHLTPEILKSLVNKFGHTGNMIDLRFLIVCLLGFNGFLRISELQHLQIKEITFCEEGVKIFIDHSKTDQTRKGETISIAKSNSPNCPVFWLKRYMDLNNLHDKKEAYLICRMFKTKKGHIVKKGEGISYSTVRGDFLERMAQVVKNPTRFCTHSMRSGGATHASESGVSDRLIGKHGRWSSNTCRDIYIRDSPTTKFSVTKRMKF